MRVRFSLVLLWAPLCAWAGGIPGADPVQLDPVEVTGERAAQPAAETASEGYVSAAQLEHRPRLRNGEMLEVVPGLIVTQHSGDGKANQYFLRGFNLDHGTDFATSVAGMPVNMPTHGHGQGYTDLGFVIPELVSGIAYKKGVYYAEEGDFSAAGSARLDYLNELPHTLVSTSLGEDDYRRILLADSFTLGGGSLLLAGEGVELDGPWVLPENAEKYNLVARYRQPLLGGSFSLTGMSYDNRWRSTDQIARRAVDSGALDRFGSLDDSTGGDTERRSLSAEYQRSTANDRLTLSAYAVDYRLNLFSNFTYFLDDAVNGDQFEQEDERQFGGARAEYQRHGEWGGLHVHQHGGLNLRRDVIGSVGLFKTRQRARLSTVRQDAVRLNALSAWYSATAHFSPWLRASAGLRGDRQEARVNAGLAQNGGEADKNLLSPKLSVQITPRDDLEVFLAAGRGFHSNDARGSTITLDPADGVTAVDKVDLLVPARGAELGLRLTPLPTLQLSASAWALNLDSELVFIGDAGNTEANRPSRRRGLELSAYYTPMPGVVLDADLAASRAHFADQDPAGERIPGSIDRTASLGLVVNQLGDLFGGLRLRYLGERPLIEDDSVRSASSSLVNLRGGWRLHPQVQIALDVFNLFDREVSDIDYFYESQLAGEAAPVEDLHFHPAEPRTVRLSLEGRF